ncbi:MAG TPA: PAS domain S-box protein [Desulfuromonadales bacterium]|nr:PAS domain S-box protein [Desulfuromonadales bacterium]
MLVISFLLEGSAVGLFRETGPLPLPSENQDLGGIHVVFGLFCFVLFVMAIQLHRILRQRRTVEEELQRTNDSLEQRIEARTRELQVSNRRLEEKTALLQTILDTIPAPIFYKDRNGVYTGCNRAFESFIGYSKDKIVGSTVYEVAPPDLAATYHRADLKLIEDGGFQVYEARVQYADGSRHDVIFNKAVTRDARGSASGLVGAMLDITDRKRTEEALETSERRFRELSQQFEALLDGISDALVLFSPDLEVVWANRGAARLFGYEHEDLKGMHCKRFWCKNTEQCTDCLRNCFISGDPVEMMDQSREGRMWGIKMFPIKNKKGEVEHVIQIISDVTEKIRLREQATQTSRLASLGELAAGVAHEINNPNAQILLDLPIIQEAIEDSMPLLDEHFLHQGDFRWGGLEFSRMRKEVPGLINEMQDASQRISNIVEDLKHFSRRERSDQMRSVDLNKTVATAVRLTKNPVKSATARFQVEYGEALPPVKGIAQRVEQVLVNLIINASQALPDRTSAIFVRTSFDEADCCCRIQIRDEGIGMNPDILSHITDPFFTTRRETGGTGLGLSIAMRIVKEHGGDLFFESAPGKGTTATLEFPVEN